MNRRVIVKTVEWLFIGAYLSAIVAANLLVARFGTAAVIPVAFLLISLDLTGRDGLHELWAEGRWWKMSLLIGCGSGISWVLNADAGWIGMSSFVAFTTANVLDTIVYQSLKGRNLLWKINISNAVSSLADSTIFLTMAFGSFMPVLILGQFGAKLVGGFLWSLVLRRILQSKAIA